MDTRFNPELSLVSPHMLRRIEAIVIVDDEDDDDEEEEDDTKHHGFHDGCVCDFDYSDPSAVSKLVGKLIGVTPKLESPADVRREARKLSDQIWAGFDKLHSIVVRYEATLHKRWARKPKQQRLKILLEAWPSMPVSHRPDFEAFRKESATQRVEGTRYRDHFLWPDFNQEDLLKPKILSLLLQARGRHPPPVFAAADYDAIHFGIASKAIKPILLIGYAMKLKGDVSAREYGKLLSWKDYPDALDLMRTQFNPGEGLLVLEIQRRIIAFLVNCCRQILHDIPADQIDSFDVQPAPNLKLEGESVGDNSSAGITAEAPYRVPAPLDLTRIEAVLSARFSAAEDHLWALREDPAYFVDQILSVKEHRPEMQKDINGKPHPTMRSHLDGLSPILWARIFYNTVIQAYRDLEMTSELVQEAGEARKLQERYANYNLNEGLPREYLDGLLKFRRCLYEAAKGPLKQLYREVVASPPLRKFFIRQSPADATQAAVVVEYNAEVKMSRTEDRLIWLLHTIADGGHDLRAIRLPLAVDELERQMQSDVEVRDLVSGRIAEVIGSLSILSQCLRQIDFLIPWGVRFESDLFGGEVNVELEVSKRTELWAKLDLALEDNLLQVVQHGNFSDKLFAYPSGRRKSKEIVQELRQAEQNLDKFWAEIDCIVYASCGKLEGTAVRRLLSQPRILQRTPEWVEEPKAAVTKADPTGSSANATLCGPLSTLYFNLGEPASPSWHQTASRDPEAKAKVKTKGATQSASNSPPATDDDDDDNAAAGVSAPTTIHVEARALKVFRTLFFNPDVTSSPGEISWTDFLHAMTSTGLFAAEKLYGSAWQFQSLGQSDQSRIQFHEPHPRGKLSFTMARRIGRRMTRAFGWVGETFVLKGKMT